MILRIRPFFFHSWVESAASLVELLEQDLNDALELALLCRRKMIEIGAHVHCDPRACATRRKARQTRDFALPLPHDLHPARTIAPTSGADGHPSLS